MCCPLPLYFHLLNGITTVVQHLFSPLSVEKADLRKSFSLPLLLREQGSFFPLPSLSLWYFSLPNQAQTCFSPSPSFSCKRCTDEIKELLCRPHEKSQRSTFQCQHLCPDSFGFLGCTDYSLKPQGFGEDEESFNHGAKH